MRAPARVYSPDPFSPETWHMNSFIDGKKFELTQLDRVLDNSAHAIHQKSPRFIDHKRERKASSRYISPQSEVKRVKYQQCHILKESDYMDCHKSNNCLSGFDHAQILDTSLKNKL